MAATTLIDEFCKKQSDTKDWDRTTIKEKIEEKPANAELLPYSQKIGDHDLQALLIIDIEIALPS